MKLSKFNQKYGKGGKSKAKQSSERFFLSWHGHAQPVNGVFPELIKKYIEDGIARGDKKSDFAISSNMRSSVDIDKFLAGKYYDLYEKGGKPKKMSQGGKPIGSTGLFSEGGKAEASTNPELRDKIYDILKKELPGFWVHVGEYNAFTGDKYYSIKMAASTKEINDVSGQRPQAVSLSLNLKTLALQPQIYGGIGGQSIYRKPNMEDAKEKYLAMKSVKIPFRKPGNNEKAVLEAIKKFAHNYKKALIENKDQLMDQDLVDYDKLLSEKYADGGKLKQTVFVAFPYRKKYVLVDDSTNLLWANELFVDKEEAIAFAKQNKLTLKDEEIHPYKKEYKLALGGKPIGSTGLFAGGGKSGSGKAYIFTSYEERGHWTIDVSDPKNQKTIWDYSYEGGEDEQNIIEDGFMKNMDDMDGLEKYLKDMKVIGKDDYLVEEKDYKDPYEDLISYTIPTWALPALVNGDRSGLSDEDEKKLDAFIEKTVKEHGNANFLLGDEEDQQPYFSHRNDIDGYIGADVEIMYINPDEDFAAGGKPIGSTGLFDGGGKLDSSFAGKSVSAGTQKEEDLYKSFMAFLKKHKSLLSKRDQDGLDEIKSEWKKTSIRERSHVIEHLYDLINSIAPEGTSFRETNGDYNYGFWKGDKFSVGGKPIGSTGLFEKGGNADDFVVHGTYTVSNAGGYEIMLNKSGDEARVRDAFGSDNPKTSDWLEIEYIQDEETGESEPVIDPNGYNIPLNMVMRARYSAGGKPIGSTGLFEKGGKSGGTIKKGDLVYVKNVGSSGLVGLVVSDRHKDSDGEYVSDVLFRGLRGETQEVYESDMVDIMDSNEGMYKADEKSDIAMYESIAKKQGLSMNKKYRESYATGGKPIGSTGLFAQGGKVTEPELLINGSYGIYIPQHFSKAYNLSDFGFTDDQVREYMKDLSDPDNENYWDSWDDLLTNAKRKDGSYLMQEDDLWLVPENFEGFDKYAQGGKPIGSTGLFSEGGSVKYKVVDGTSYHDETPTSVIDILEQSRKHKKRIILDYGDVKTGKSWGDVHDVKGYIGRSTGDIKIPLLIYNSRSTGGGGVLDHCIIKITESQGGKVLYQHPDYKPADSFDQGGKPIGSTGLFSDGGKPIGSTGLFAEGGSVSLPYSKNITLGEVDYDSRGRKINEVEVTINIRKHDVEINWQTLEKVHNAPSLAVSVGFWNSKKTDIIAGGQMVHELRKFFPGNKKIAKLVKIWEQYHLNDLKAGTKKQTEAIDKWEADGNTYDFTKASEYLESIGLYEDNGYAYGSKWLYQPIPEEVIKEVIEIADSFPSFERYELGGKLIGSTGLFERGGSVAAYDDESKYDDYHYANEIELYAENNNDLHRQRYVPIMRNLKKKLNKETYDESLAAVLWKYWVEDADKRYQKEILGREPKGYLLSVNDRKLLAQKQAAFTTEEYGANKLDSYEKGGSTGGVNVDDVLHHYMVAALWSSSDDEEPMDRNYDLGDISEETKTKMRQDVEKFVKDNEATIKESGLTDDQVGHSFWLTQNHHGAGFFDYGTDAADKLDEATKKFKGIDLYVGDDGKIYHMGSYAAGGTAEVEEKVERISNQEANVYSENKIPFKGHDLEGKKLDNGDYLVQSFGFYPIWYWCAKNNSWYGNSDKFSVATAKHITQSRPDWNATILPLPELLETMKKDQEATYDLGGLMVRPAMLTDNTLGAHAGSPDLSQNIQ